MNPLTSDELNYLIFRYLHESGFMHSAFLLSHEAGLHKNPIDGNSVPPGALLKLVQNGLQYLQLEETSSDDEADTKEDLKLLSPLDIITKEANELQKTIRVKQERANIIDAAVGDAHESPNIVGALDTEKEKQASKSFNENPSAILDSNEGSASRLSKPDPESPVKKMRSLADIYRSLDLALLKKGPENGNK